MHPIVLALMAANRIISESTITSGDLHIATKAGEAMFFVDGLDFDSLDGVSYKGTDAGSTPYRFVFTDSAGKTAVAYGGALGGGEALGSELVTNSGFDSDTTGWSARSSALLASVAGGQAGNCLQITEDGETDPWAVGTFAPVTGRLFRIQFYVKSGTNSVYRLYGTNATSWGTAPSSSDQTSTGDWVLQGPFYNTALANSPNVTFVIKNICASSCGAYEGQP